MGNAKVSKEEKVKAVEKFFTGDYSMRMLAAEYNVHHSSIEKWVGLYKTFGPDGFETGRINRVYPEELKIEAVTVYLTSGRSLLDVCKQYGIRSISLLQIWIKKYAVSTEA